MNTRKAMMGSSPDWRAAKPAVGKADGTWGITSGLSFAEFALRSGLMAPRLLGLGSTAPRSGGTRTTFGRTAQPAAARAMCRSGEE